MPSGRVHAAFTLVTGAGVAYYGYQAGYPLPEIAAASGGVFLGLLLSPDLDVDQGSISFEYARNLFGGLFGAVWAMVWKPYSYLIPHRSPLSHFPVLGTVIRLGYLAGVLYLGLYLLHWTGAITRPVLPSWAPFTFWGLCLADTLHFFLDNLPKRKHHRRSGDKNNRSAGSL